MTIKKFHVVTTSMILQSRRDGNIYILVGPIATPLSFPSQYLPRSRFADCPLFINAIKETECRPSAAGFILCRCAPRSKRERISFYVKGNEGVEERVERVVDAWFANKYPCVLQKFRKRRRFNRRLANLDIAPAIATLNSEINSKIFSHREHA